MMENVLDAPLPVVDDYHIHAQALADVWVGGATSRTRRVSYGTRGTAYLGIEQTLLTSQDVARAVVGDSRAVPVRFGAGGRPKGGGRMPHVGRQMPVGRMLELQGFDPALLDECPLTVEGKRKAIGNGVPLAMGRAVAKAVKRALGVDMVEAAS